MHGNETILLIARLAGGLGMGALCGLMPRRAAHRKQKPEYGQASLFYCMFAGILGGVLLALPTAIVTTIMINNRNLRDSRDSGSGTAATGEAAG